MKLHSLFLLFFLSFSCFVSAQDKGAANQKVQRHIVVTNENFYYVFVNDSLSGAILKDASVSLLYKGDTIKGEKSKFMSPDNPFSFQLVPGRKVMIIVNCPGYKSASYDVTMSLTRKWFESQLVK